MCRALVEQWPVDLITANEIDARLPIGSCVSKTNARHAMDRAGITKLKKVRHGGGTVTVYALRNHEVWSRRDPDCIRGDLDCAATDQKSAAMNETGVAS